MYLALAVLSFLSSLVQLLAAVPMLKNMMREVLPIDSDMQLMVGGSSPGTAVRSGGDKATMTWR